MGNESAGSGAPVEDGQDLLLAHKSNLNPKRRDDSTMTELRQSERPMIAFQSFGHHGIPVQAISSDVSSMNPSAGCQWVRDNHEAIHRELERVGAVLIRGFQVYDPEAFRAVCSALGVTLRNYVGGDSPRTGLDEQVYTSTEYPAELEVLLHNELSYGVWSPAQVDFGCLIPADAGGETPIADGREIYRKLDVSIRSRFESKGVAYLQHLWDFEGPIGIGKSWQETFETSDKRWVESHLEQGGIEYEWSRFGLRTRTVRPAVIDHPTTNERCWHNQADQWHRDLDSVKVSIGSNNDPRFDPATSGEASLGNHVTYGDGSEIDVQDLMAIRDVCRQCECTFPWQAGEQMAQHRRQLPTSSKTAPNATARSCIGVLRTTSNRSPRL